PLRRKARLPRSCGGTTRLPPWPWRGNRRGGRGRRPPTSLRVGRSCRPRSARCREPLASLPRGTARGSASRPPSRRSRPFADATGAFVWENRPSCSFDFSIRQEKSDSPWPKELSYYARYGSTIRARFDAFLHDTPAFASEGKRRPEFVRRKS